MKKYVVDTSAIIERIVTTNKIRGNIIIPNAVVAELEAQANRGQEIGMIGLEEIQELQKRSIKVTFAGSRPSSSQIKYAKSGEIDALIREIAFTEKATLITADRVQAASAKAYNIPVLFIETKPLKAKLEIEKFFDKNTMSVHIKEDCPVTAKKGSPGKWELKRVSAPLSKEKVKEMSKEILEKSRIERNAFIEIARESSTIIQYKEYRIIMVKPPVSDGWEITAVRPIKKLSLEYYNNDFLKKGKLRGIIISGEVGSGKSTLAQAIAEYYSKQGKITKTVESPRDLQLAKPITQYSKSFTSSEEIHDILFLSRPDFIIFDEMRDTPDFRLYTDLRLAGSNCLGVLHAASAIDAVQRFIGRIETGMIPSILDTILFMESGQIKTIYSLKMTVKVPTGMTEADLARPVVEVFNEHNKLEFEIYSYGEETVVIPVQEAKKISTTLLLAQSQLENQFKKYSQSARLELVNEHKAIVYVQEKEIPRIIGTKGVHIEKIEKDLGISIEVRELEPKEIKYSIIESKNSIIFKLSHNPHREVKIFLEGMPLFTSKTDNKSNIKIHKRSDLGKTIQDSLNSNKKIEIKN